MPIDSSALRYFKLGVKKVSRWLAGKPDWRVWCNKNATSSACRRTDRRKPETSGMLQLCEELDVKVLAYSPLGQGLLTGKYSKDFVPR